LAPDKVRHAQAAAYAAVTGVLHFRPPTLGILDPCPHTIVTSA